MIIPKDIDNKKIGILGLGISGNSALRSVKAAGAQAFVFDDSKYKKSYIDNTNNWPWKELNQIVVSPGISLKHPIVKKAKKNNIEIINEIDLFARSFPKAKVIGVTGTNGKSTTVSLLSHIIKLSGYKVQVGGNIGMAATSLRDPGVNGFIILELSSFQLAVCKDLKLDGAIILNITPDHLDWHGTLKNYFNSKIKIASFLKKGAPIIISENNGQIKKAVIKINGTDKNVFEVSNKDKNYLCSINYEPFNNQNILATLKLLELLGISKDKSLSAINSFTGLPHRMERFAKKNNISFVNDSKATNSEAASNALINFKNIYWIAGGVSKSNGIKPSLKYLQNVRKVYLIGESKIEFFNHLKTKTNCSIEGTIDKALNRIFHDTINCHEDITVLFSPGAASFDQFKNFENRGNIFKELTLKKWCI